MVRMMAVEVALVHENLNSIVVVGTGRSQDPLPVYV